LDITIEDPSFMRHDYRFYVQLMGNCLLLVAWSGIVTSKHLLWSDLRSKGSPVDCDANRKVFWNSVKPYSSVEEEGVTSLSIF
jgi:hypothetical protein